MISCEEVRRHLPDFHYQLLPEWEAEEISAHLQGCACCQGAHRSIRAEVAAFDRWQVPPPPATLRPGFERRLQVEHGISLQKPPFWTKLAQIVRTPITLRGMMLASTVAATLAVVGLGALQWHGSAMVAAYTRDFQQMERTPQPARFAQFVSADPKRASNWLDRSAEFAIKSPDLSAEGLRLIGVRLDSTGRMNAAVWIYSWGGQQALLFERPKDMFPIPAWKSIRSRGREFTSAQSGGLNVLMWKERDRAFALVSPVSETAMAHMLANSLERQERLRIAECQGR